MILESGLTESINSPFIVPVASFIMVLGIVAVGAWSNARKRELESQERLAAIAKGITPPPTAAELAATQGRPAVSVIRRRANIRLAGIVLLGAAVGIALFFIALATILQERDVLCGAACALIPLGIGVGFLIDTRIQSREIDESTAPPTAPHSFNS
jgi:uncharacterized membrane protein